jgi:hypothetical protein
MMSSGWIHTASHSLHIRDLIGRTKIRRPGGYMLSGVPMRDLHSEVVAQQQPQ